MKLLKPGVVIAKTYRVKCYKCQAELEYTKQDVFCQRNEDYVECPCCKSFIDHTEKNVVVEEVQQLNG